MTRRSDPLPAAPGVALTEIWEVAAVCTCGQVWQKQARRWHHLRDTVEAIRNHRTREGHHVWLRTVKIQHSWPDHRQLAVWLEAAEQVMGERSRSRQ